MKKYTSQSQDENPPSLQAFLSAKTDAEILAAAKDALPCYASYPKGSDDFNYETVSLLEVAAEEGKLDHVRVLLAWNETQDSDIFRSFYRALEQHQQAVALLLLERIDESELALVLLQTKGNPLIEEWHGDYLAKISDTKHYVFGFNNFAVTGNVALIMAAALPDAKLFNRLLSFDSLVNQLDASAITAFLSATLAKGGSVKKVINTEVVYQLLLLPIVALYAESRSFDYETLLQGFKAHNEKEKLSYALQRDCVSSISSLTSMDISSRATSSMGEAHSPTYDIRYSSASGRPICLSPGGVRIASRVTPILRHTPSFFGPDTPRPSALNTPVSVATDIESASFRTFTSVEAFTPVSPIVELNDDEKKAYSSAV